MYGDVAVCSAIRRADGSAPLLVPAPGEWAWQCPLPSVGRARLPPLATCCRPGRGAVRCRGGGSASGIGCSSRRTLWRRCPVACPLHCLYARDGLRPGSELPPSLVHRARRCYRAVAWLLALPLRCPRAARRAGDAIPARAPAAGARHHPASLRGGRRALACACGCATLEGAGGAAATAAALLERALRRGRLPGRADESVAPKCSVRNLPWAQAPRWPGAPALRRLRTPPPLPSHSAQRAAGASPPPTCSAAMWRSAVLSASVAALSPRPGARRLDLTASPAVGGAPSPHPLGDACCRPGRGPVHYARRRVGEQRWCSLRRTLWRRARLHARCTACVPEAMCG